MKRLLSVVGIILLVVSAAPAAAQKGKPVSSVRWTLEIRGATDPNVATMMGGLDFMEVRGYGVVFDPAASAEVSFTAAGSDDSNPSNRFNFQLKNANPLLPKQTADPTRWVSFRNFQFQDEGMDFGSAWGPYSENADRLGPVWQAAGTWRWPFLVADKVQPYGRPDYQTSFINSDGHPRQYYTTATLIVAFPGVSFLDLPAGAQTEVEAKTGIAIWAKRDCNDPKAVEVGMALGRAEESIALPQMSKLAVVTRLNENQWQIEIDQPIRLIEFGCRETTRVVGRKTVTSCTTYPAGGWWTFPVRFALIVTRITA